MASSYTENPNTWKELSDLDYMFEYVKVWITFNAWYINSFESKNSERSYINAIKSEANSVRDRIKSHLTGSTNSNLVFKEHLASLHAILENQVIPDDETRLRFTSLVIDYNHKKLSQLTKNGIQYKVEKGPAGKPKNTIQCLILDSNGKTIFTEEHEGYDISKLESNTNWNSISERQQNTIKRQYLEINPRKPFNLVNGTKLNSIEVGDNRFINDADQVAAGIIEMLYMLRNILFHGRLTPNKVKKQVYKPAYYMLKDLVDNT